MNNEHSNDCNASNEESNIDSTDCAQENKQSNQQESNQNDNKQETNDVNTNEANEWKEKYIRVYADFENVKKRLEREKYQALEYANEAILKDFLPIIDTLESAYNGISDDEENPTLKSIKDGIKLTLDNFTKVLNKHRVEELPCDSGFDPNIHEAIMQTSDENKEHGTIDKVFQKGYKYKDRILRPAMVSTIKNNKGATNE